MNKKPIVYVSTCAIIDSNDRILITSRENRNDFSNCWEFPGGKIEENETLTYFNIQKKMNIHYIKS